MKGVEYMRLGKNVTLANIYCKTSNLPKPFWGLTKNRLNQLRIAGKDYYVILKYRGGKIILTSDDVDELISKKNAAKDGDYKITFSDVKKFDKKI